MEPVTTFALETARRVLLRRLLKILAWAMPLVLCAALSAVVYASVLIGGLDDSPRGSTGACGGLTTPTVVADGGMDAEQMANVQTIAAVGRRLNVPPKGLVIAVATAMQESTLHNVPYGDRDSLGLFQQRDPWGSRAERLDPATAAELFFSGGRGGQPGLLSIANYLTMTVAEAAQAVQRSQFPDAYAKWEPLATRLLGLPAVEAATCASGVTGGGSSAIVAAAMKWIGTPYSWGGGSLEGPTLGIESGADTVGFDCSGLTRYAVYQATGRVIPRVATDQAAALTPVPIDQIQAGDLLFFHNRFDPPGVYHHVGIADGQGGMIHAPTTGALVEVVQGVLNNAYWSSDLAVVGRP